MAIFEHTPPCFARNDVQSYTSFHQRLVLLISAAVVKEADQWKPPLTPDGYRGSHTSYNRPPPDTDQSIHFQSITCIYSKRPNHLISTCPVWSKPRAGGRWKVVAVCPAACSFCWLASNHNILFGIGWTKHGCRGGKHGTEADRAAKWNPQPIKYMSKATAARVNKHWGMNTHSTPRSALSHTLSKHRCSNQGNKYPSRLQ